LSVLKAVEETFTLVIKRVGKSIIRCQGWCPLEGGIFGTFKRLNATLRLRNLYDGIFFCEWGCCNYANERNGGFCVFNSNSLINSNIDFENSIILKPKIHLSQILSLLNS